MASWLPVVITKRVQRVFQRRPPPLHRALGVNNHDHDHDHNEAAVGLVEKLATKRRVRRRDAFQRNALHVAVRTRYTTGIIATLCCFCC